jgi:hypothetical protein
VFIKGTRVRGGSKTFDSTIFHLKIVGRWSCAEGQGMTYSARGGRPPGAEHPAGRWSDVSKVTRIDVCSGRSLVFVDDAAEDVAAGDGCLVDRRAREGTGDRRGELQATMRSRLVVVADVLIEDRFEMSP